ncbi:MAG: Stk1 family PASTA domain-containing Ser/Thr kinase [Solobacterium sp.]|nr:Stk1 family PASTA domain-containing Ser/Thr kinase [Solobacterium sp.]
MSKNMIANRYEVFQHIGQGGMADVFLAVDTILNRQVAIKILRSELCTDAVSVLRFEREAQAATTLSHPNIVEIYDVGDYKGHHYIVMEYVPGKTLKKVIHDRGALLTAEAIDIEKQLVSATGEAHRRGIIHRDIKPQNVIVKADGSIKILDFGIALAKGSMQLTEANNVMGSVHYLAPELAKGESASVQSDIYALGIVLFEMLTGDVPFKADSAVQVALMQMRNEIPPVRSINPELPQSIENVIIRATAKDPAMRYRSCTEMLQDLSTCLRPERANEKRVVLSARQVPTDHGFDTLPEHVLTDTGGPSPKVETIIRSSNSKVVQPAVKKKTKNRIKPLTILLIVLLFILGASGVYFALRTLQQMNEESRHVEVPDIIGLTVAEASTVCDENNLVIDGHNISYTLTESTEKGKIIAVEPGVGTEIERGSSLKLTVSSGLYAVAPNLIGKSLEEVQQMLSEPQYSNIILETVEQQAEGAEPGTVISQELLEVGEQFNPAAKTELRIVYVAYPTIEIPWELEWMPIEDAERTLTEMGARVFTSPLDDSSLSEEEKENLARGVVIKCDPEFGTAYTQREDNYIILFYY